MKNLKLNLKLLFNEIKKEIKIKEGKKKRENNIVASKRHQNNFSEQN